MPTRAAADRTFEGCLSSFLEELRVQRCSRSYQALGALALRRLSRHLPSRARQDVQAVREEHLVSHARFLAHAASRWGGPIKPASRAAELGLVRRFFSFLARHGLILRDPAAELVVPKGSSLPRAVLSLSQARRLMTVPNAGTVLGCRDRGILELLYGTGIRLFECMGLDLTDLDLSQGLLLVRNGKGRRDRYVPVAGQAEVALELYLRSSRPELVKCAEPALFLSLRGRRLSRSRLPRLVKAYGRAVGVEISTHSLRHACATHLLRGGADIRHVQVLLGHRRLDSTAIYTRVEVEDLREVLRRCHPREGG